MQESFLNEKTTEEFVENEVYSQLRVPKGIPFVVRLDGWKFQSLCEKIKAKKPFDERIAKSLVYAGKEILRNFNPLIAYVISDEINAIFTKNYPFNGRIEKINSVFASLASSAFNLNLRKYFKEAKLIPVSFDSRVIVLRERDILGYLGWRQQNGWRNHNNAYAYWLLRKLGYSAKEAADKLKGLKTKQIHELLFKHGINLSETPAWQRRGIIIYRETYEKEMEGMRVKRRRIAENWNPPLFTTLEGKELIQRLIEKSAEKTNK